MGKDSDEISYISLLRNLLNDLFHMKSFKLLFWKERTNTEGCFEAKSRTLRSRGKQIRKVLQSCADRVGRADDSRDPETLRNVGKMLRKC